MACAQSIRVFAASSGVRANSFSQRRPSLRVKTHGLPKFGSQQSRRSSFGNRIITRAETKDVDFDGILSDLADKFEKSDKKAAVVGWTAAGVGAFFVTEWLLHLPLLDVLIGILLLPYLYVKYAVEGDNIVDDVGNAAKKVTKQLPGLEK